LLALRLLSGSIPLLPSFNIKTYYVDAYYLDALFDPELLVTITLSKKEGPQPLWYTSAIYCAEFVMKTDALVPRPVFALARRLARHSPQQVEPESLLCTTA
jgi:hypothetical protein